MSRYIDADAMKEWIDEYVSVFKKSDNKDIKGYIEHQPTIEAVPKEFHDKTCEAMAKRHQEEIADMVRIADRPQGEVDAIDRDALIDYCLKLIDVERKQGSDAMNYGQERVNQTEAIIDYIEHMPHLNADRPHGEWIEHKERTIVRNNNFIDFFPTEYECSNCGLRRATYSINSPLSNFCPNCGADMRGADDE